ncbi:MAG: amino acid permease [Armatimonadetes bacterium]|nr:amino acid permease [Armatimonadota bacterium]
MIAQDRSDADRPRPTLSSADALALIVGLVVGVGLYKTPSLVAANTGSGALFLLAWLLGGVVSLMGALCYAELATAYPHVGGDYHYLSRAFGREIAFLFSWARMTVIQTGSIAMLAFVFGDYASRILSLGPYGSPLMAACAVAALTGLHACGVRQGKWTQNLLTAAKVVGIALVLGVGFLAASRPLPEAAAPAAQKPAFGMAMIFILLCYGGWNEAAYISAELRDNRRSMRRVLFWSIGLITLIYLLANTAYLSGLGMAALSGSEVVAADLMEKGLPGSGSGFISLLIAVSVLGAANATIFTGARSCYALGQDFPPFAFLGRWHGRSQTPLPALLAQGALSLALVALGSLTRKGFETMVDYTAPVFWFFFLLSGLSLFVLRAREPEVPRPFQTPLYPLIPLLFCATCVYMLHSSLAYTGMGAVVGVVVLMAGAPLLLFSRLGKSEEMARASLER